jgi:hypothetical protein
MTNHVTLPITSRRADGAGKCAERGAEERPAAGQMVGQAATIVATPTGPISPARTPRWDAGGERGRQKKGIWGELGGEGVLGTTGSEADNSTLEMSRLGRLLDDSF